MLKIPLVDSAICPKVASLTIICLVGAGSPVAIVRPFTGTPTTCGYTVTCLPTLCAQVLLLVKPEVFRVKSISSGSAKSPCNLLFSSQQGDKTGGLFA